MNRPQFIVQACRLRVGDDSLEDARYYSSMKNALIDFKATATSLARFEQKIEASLHFVDGINDEPAEYPDRILSLGPRGGVQVVVA